MNETYTLNEVCRKLGLTDDDAEVIVRNGFADFPFSVISVQSTGNRKFHLISKAQVDRFLVDGRKPHAADNKNRHKKRLGTEYFCNYNFPVTRELAERFNRICKNINRDTITPICKQDLLRLAVQEFIDRRPEYLEGDDS